MQHQDRGLQLLRNFSEQLAAHGKELVFVDIFLARGQAVDPAAAILIACHQP
jgi:hypothetical protein